ncbi:BREX-2 system phosphatase PglZ [Nannocystis bainbridge]|uniref:BREX-2 system phosphatase PglZ n=1 Tax=Nannocystis bainbridge TaxID=2995303 RepID=A0ABT5E754_9BACT|nr:BREX-2 system phosphatase PglZ [Nannocystis bainbridge]MDC0721694.1 BREX-2 system phosphatase PglZ [Nannocystis bainbridge]
MSAAHLLLRGLLEKSGGANEKGFLLVIDSEGLENLPEQMTTPKGVYRVHRIATELGLRHLLWRAKGAPLIAVMPEAVALQIQKAPDILRRAQDQRVHALTINDVLEAHLGVRVVGADAPYMQKLALEHVHKLGVMMSHRTLPTVIDRRLLTEMLVDVSVGERVRTQTPAQLLAAWVQEPPQWSLGVSQLVRDALLTMHGDDGRLLSWALAQPERRLRQLVIHGAILTVEVPELGKPVWGPLWQAATEPPLEMDRRILRRVLTRLAEDTLAILGDLATPLLDEADRIGRECLLPAQLQTSHVLPLAFASRCHALAKQAADGKAISLAEISWLTAHRSANINRVSLAVLVAMGRLSRYLDQPFTPSTDILAQVQDYQRNGAFADLAILQLRRALASSAAHHAEAKSVLTAAYARRERENQQFAAALAAGYEAALHHTGLTPLHRLWKRTVAPVWQQDPGARLFLVVLDGCSYPVFLELLHALSQDNTFPIGIRPDADGRVAGIPALSPLPTITSHARGAIFLGELPQDPLAAETVFRDEQEAKTDKARFNQNKALERRNRRLFLKADLADGGQALLAALADESLDVVAAVFNAVDDQIGSVNTGSTVRLSPEDISAFKPSLQVALKSRRKILVTADHGHSPYVENKLRVGAGKGAPRFLPLGKNAAPDSFIEIDLGGLGGPPERRAFAWRSGAYLGSPQVGFHGGCSLEEMVVPLAWLERDGLHADEPAWWFGQGSVVEPVPPPRPVELPIETPSDKLPTAPKPQLTLFNPAERADALPLPPELLAKLGNDEKSVLVLLRENGSARASELAERLRKNPGRLNGLMVTLKRALHASGHTLFTDEKLPSGETMYRYQGKDR